MSTRIDRQNILYESTRDLRFVVTESALRWQIVSPARMAEQIDRIISLSRLSGIDVRVVPLSARQTHIASHAFVVRDERVADIETIHADVVVTDPRDVALYVQKFEVFSSAAFSGDDMRTMLATIREEFLREQETD